MSALSPQSPSRRPLSPRRVLRIKYAETGQVFEMPFFTNSTTWVKVAFNFGLHEFHAKFASVDGKILWKLYLFWQGARLLQRASCCSSDLLLINCWLKRRYEAGELVFVPCPNLLSFIHVKFGPQMQSERQKLYLFEKEKPSSKSVGRKLPVFDSKLIRLLPESAGNEKRLTHILER